MDTQELRQLIEYFVSFEDIFDNFPAAPYLNVLSSHLPYSDQRLRRIKVGSLWWPQGATRWAMGHFIATESQLAAIRTVLGYDQPNFVLNAAPLILSDGTTTITANMWMLPPRPLFQNTLDPAVSPTNSTLPITKWLLPITYNSFPNDALGNTTQPPGEPVYLLTFVDDRYYWWQKHSTVAINVGTTTWGDLIANIGSDLAVSIATDSIDSSYGKPTNVFAPYFKYLPFLLDHVALAIGQRVIRGLDGSVSLQNGLTAQASVNSQLAAAPSPVMGAGVFAFDLS